MTRDVGRHQQAGQGRLESGTTPFERVYEIVEQTHDGQSAAGLPTAPS